MYVVTKLHLGGKYLRYIYICQKDGYIALVLIFFYRCHVCRKEMTTIPALKTHIKQHSYKKS